MSSSGNEVRVPIGIPVETNAKQATNDVAALRDAISRSKDAIRDASEQMRNLSGKSAEVKAAKDQLRAAIDREKATVSGANLQLVRQGQNYEKLARAQVEAKKRVEEWRKEQAKVLAQRSEDRAKGLSNAVSQAGGPLARFRDLLRSVGDVSGTGSAKLNLTTLAVGGLAAAAVATTVAVAGLLVGLGKWAISGADAARSMQLVREASTTSTLNARNLGTQIDALAGKVPTSVAALNELATSLTRSGLSGAQAVDALNAVAQANSAVGDASGAKIREVIERGKTMQRMFLGLRELQGTGLDFQDVAGSLAKNLGVGVKDAQAALLEGRVKLADGAKAMRDAVEQKFGGINVRKLTTLSGLSDQLSKKWSKLTDAIDLERAGQAAFSFLQSFDEATATGRVLKRAVTVFGDGITKALEKGAPIAKQFLRGMIIGGLELYIGYLKVKNVFRDAIKQFGDSDLLKNVDAMKVALEGGKFAIGAIAITVGVVAAAVGVFAGSFIAAGAAVQGLTNAGIAFGDWLKEIDWKATGVSIVDGLVDGLKSGPKRLADASIELGNAVKRGFKDALGIRSPSVVMEREAKQVPAGVVRGVEKGAPAADRAVAEMVTPPSFAAAGGAGGAASVTITVNATIVLQNGDAKAARTAVRDPGLLAELTKTFKEAAGAAGLRVATS